MRSVHGKLCKAALAAACVVGAMGCGQSFTEAGTAGAAGSPTTGDTGSAGTAGTGGHAGTGGAGGSTSSGSGGATMPDPCAELGTKTKLYFFDAFGPGDDKWALDETWEIGPAAPSTSNAAGFNGDPKEDHSPNLNNELAGVKIGGDAPTNVHDFFYMTTMAGLDTSAEPDKLVLVYQRWLNSDAPGIMTSKVEVGDGDQWSLVWDNKDAVADDKWVRQASELSDAKRPSLKIRFGYSVSEGAKSVSSWNVDDVFLVGCH